MSGGEGGPVGGPGRRGEHGVSCVRPTTVRDVEPVQDTRRDLRGGPRGTGDTSNRVSTDGTRGTGTERGPPSTRPWSGGAGRRPWDPGPRPPEAVRVAVDPPSSSRKGPSWSTHPRGPSLSPVPLPVPRTRRRPRHQVSLRGTKTPSTTPPPGPGRLVRSLGQSSRSVCS